MEEVIVAKAVEIALVAAKTLAANNAPMMCLLTGIIGGGMGIALILQELERRQ